MSSPSGGQSLLRIVMHGRSLIKSVFSNLLAKPLTLPVHSRSIPPFSSPLLNPRYSLSSLKFTSVPSHIAPFSHQFHAGRSNRTRNHTTTTQTKTKTDPIKMPAKSHPSIVGTSTSPHSSFAVHPSDLLKTIIKSENAYTT